MDYLVESSQQQATSSQRQVFTVSQLNRKVKGLLEIHLPLIWIEGEISNFTCPRSGHWYFTLKDEQAQVRAAMFKGRNQSVKTRPKEGDKVLIRARVSLYEGRGDYQLIAEHMETAGLGLLQQQFEELKLKLHQQGLFNEAHKKPFPRIPKHIAVVTSPSGAAIQDVLSVLARRFPALQVSIIPASVQGELAPQELIRGLTTADAANMFDTIPSPILLPTTARPRPVLPPNISAQTKMNCANSTTITAKPSPVPLGKKLTTLGSG